MIDLPDDEALLLELLNTSPVEGGVPTDALRDDAEAVAWATERGGAGTLQEVTTVRQVRDALQSVVRGEEQPAALDTFLRDAAMIPTVTSGGVGWRLRAAPDDTLAVRVVLAWGALERDHPGRLRSCGNPECHRFLIDRSHANRAQWCSMALCGNRMKARRHYERKRQAAGGSAPGRR
ncbi:CGNR zinc finger domain-containing protein [Oerskovia flava]|uniref:CGNR zinc finger domain-containing protein n=1 Tax=Oerskovia flava TaxID=2986422 RepID=UPI0022408335|nr:CGNR zinc finger domain-containing protein [Oerskovia sp. JB1-3-2]